MDIQFQCTKDSFKGSLHSCVVAFDAYENFEALSEFYVSFDKNLVFTKEAYFKGGVPYDTWDDYVIWDHGKAYLVQQYGNIAKAPGRLRLYPLCRSFAAMVMAKCLSVTVLRSF